ncbi:pectate lyase superfamily protein [Metarhizium robertsii]|uniref:Glycoside hydrolase family 55 n=2 Tax=Metarhizium robertsii TaxID=568076 RepID=E9FAA7_METRA|nr:glycoside hydrolase family 55 [Metarhizium robertsii ARSEF 23]EFY95392.1 glycoside hydrolase family 55 [Metarhizium robertsii ARSEF 23]EXU97419.1 pectate lyase superfamily protein [Metarhizium robertsii]
MGAYPGGLIYLNATLPSRSAHWYSVMAHGGPSSGFAPYVDHPEEYQVFLSAKANKSETIQGAIDYATGLNYNAAQERHGYWVSSMPRVVYVPPGIYTFENPLVMNTDTILMGDARHPPVIRAAPNFAHDVLLNGMAPSYMPNAGELANTVALKNIILDTTAVNRSKELTALYWGVAQGSHLQNVQIVMPQSTDRKDGHTGIRLGVGSILSLGDVRIENGLTGIWHDGHQSALFKNISFYRNTVGLRVSNGSAVTLLAPTFENVDVCVNHTSGSAFVGIVDGTSINSGLTFLSGRTKNDMTRPSLLIDNLEKRRDPEYEPENTVQVKGRTVLGPVDHVHSFSYGNKVGRNHIYGVTTDNSITRSRIAAPGGRIPIHPPPNYALSAWSDFINVKDSKQNGGHTVRGDGMTDDVRALTKVLQHAVKEHKIVYFPFGDYRISSTLVIPIGSRIHGEAWPSISGAGPRFSNAENPKPVVQVGNVGDVGTIHIQDMRFTVADVSPGAIILQFHAHGKKPGDVAIWNSIVNVGGLRGAPDMVRRCADDSHPCQAAYLGMHFARGSSVYAENVWNWVSSRNAEDFFAGVDIAAKGGVLVESTNGTWLHGLGSEHWWQYQLNLRSASNVVLSMPRTEANPEQGGTAKPMLPWPGTSDPGGWGDPDYSRCRVSDPGCRTGVGNYINGGSDIYYYGAASWVSRDGPEHPRCYAGYHCQEHMHYIAKTPENLQAYGLCSNDTMYALRLGDGTRVVEHGTFYGPGWPKGSVVGRYTT